MKISSVKKTLLSFGVLIGLLGASISSVNAAENTKDSGVVEAKNTPENAYWFTDTLAEGKVIDSNGKPVADANIEVYAIPPTETLTKMREGDSFDLTLVGKGVSGKEGNYRISTDFEALAKVSKLSSKTSPLNFTFLVSSPTEFIAYNATIEFANGSNSGIMTNLLPSSRVSVTQNEKNNLVTEISFQTETRPSEKTDVQPAGAPNNCSLTETLGARDVYVGQTSSTTSGGFSHRWIYSTGSSTTLGIGYSLTGSSGTWSQSGTSAISSSTTTSFPTSSSASSQLMVTKYTFGKFYCFAGVVPTKYYQVYPTGHYGGATTLATTTPNANQCAPYQAGSSFSKTTSSAVTYTNGAQLSTIIGINLSAKTGFTSSAKYEASMTSSKRICGVVDGPSGSPSQLVVKAP